MELKEFVRIIFEKKNHVSKYRKFKAYCEYFYQHPYELVFRDEIDLIYPEFKKYINHFPQLFVCADVFGDFTYNINRLRTLIKLKEGDITYRQYQSMCKCARAIVKKHINDGNYSILFSKYFMNNSFTPPYPNICREKHVIYPGDINLLALEEAFIDNNYEIHPDNK